MSTPNPRFPSASFMHGVGCKVLFALLYSKSRNNMVIHLGFSPPYPLRIKAQSRLMISGAFSLIELVIVVAILGILTAVSLPSLLGNTEKAKVVSAQISLRNAVSECLEAISSGVPREELIFPNISPNTVPALFEAPDGYNYNTSKGGCHAIYLEPTAGFGLSTDGTGYPVLQAKIGARGRVIRAFQHCQPVGHVDVPAECRRWDPNAVSTSCKDAKGKKSQYECKLEYGDGVLSFSSNRQGLNDPEGSWLVNE